MDAVPRLSPVRHACRARYATTTYAWCVLWRKILSPCPKFLRQATPSLFGNIVQARPVSAFARAPCLARGGRRLGLARRPQSRVAAPAHSSDRTLRPLHVSPRACAPHPHHPHCGCRALGRSVGAKDARVRLALQDDELDRARAVRAVRTAHAHGAPRVPDAPPPSPPAPCLHTSRPLMRTIAHPCVQPASSPRTSTPTDGNFHGRPSSPPRRATSSRTSSRTAASTRADTIGALGQHVSRV